MMNKMKRFMALLTSVMMLMNMMPITALADTSGGLVVVNPINITINYVYAGGNQQSAPVLYDTVQVQPTDDSNSCTVYKPDFTLEDDNLVYKNGSQISVKYNGGDLWHNNVARDNNAGTVTFTDLAKLSQEGINDIEVTFYYEAAYKFEFRVDLSTAEDLPQGVTSTFKHNDKVLKLNSDGSGFIELPAETHLLNTSFNIGGLHGQLTGYTANNGKNYYIAPNSAEHVPWKEELPPLGSTIYKVYDLMSRESGDVFKPKFALRYLNEFNSQFDGTGAWETFTGDYSIFTHFGETVRIPWARTTVASFPPGQNVLEYYKEARLELWYYRADSADPRNDANAEDSVSKPHTIPMETDLVFTGGLRNPYPDVNGEKQPQWYLLYKFDKPAQFTVEYFIDDVYYAPYGTKTLRPFAKTVNGTEKGDSVTVEAIPALPEGAEYEYSSTQKWDFVLEDYNGNRGKINSTVNTSGSAIDLSRVVGTVGSKFNMVDRHIDYYVYTLITVNYESEDTAMGTVDHAQDKPKRKDGDVVLGSTAQPKDGYEFEGWYKGDQLITTDETLSPTLAHQHLNKNGEWFANTTYVAKFREATTDAETINVSVTKSWNDGNDRDGIQPESVTVQLKANGANEGEAVTLNAGKNWSHTWRGLDKSKTYTVEETSIPDGYTSSTTYTTAANGSISYTITNTHTPKTISVSATKVWDDEDNQDGKRTDVELTLYKTVNGEKTLVEAKIIAKGATEAARTVTWSPLYAYENGSPITYTVEETSAPAGYTVDIDSETAEDGSISYTITNTYEPAKIDVVARKVWDDSNNQDGMRKDVTLHLYKKVGDAEAAIVSGQDKTISATATGDALQVKWEDLPAYENGQKITYTVVEDQIAGYELPAYDTVSSSDSTVVYKVTNKHTPEKITISGVKVWEGDADYSALTRPDSVTIRIKKGDQVVGTTTADAANNWEWSVSDLPKYEAGDEINYTVVEDAVTGYTTEPIVYNEETGKYEVTNRLNTTQVSVTKAWNDQNDKEEKRPGSIQVQLKADGTKLGNPVTLSEGQWSYTWSNLPETNKNGTSIQYTVDELSEPAGYEKTISGDQENGFTITNTYVFGVPAQIEAKKVLSGRTLANEQFSFQLKDAQGNVIDTQKNDADGNVTFDLSFNAPNTYTYTISEVNDGQAGYTYSAAVYNVTVTVSQDASTKQLSASVSYTNLSAGTTVPTFENTYTAQPAELSIPVVKNYVHAANLNAPDITNKFQFTITGEVQGDAAAVAPLPSDTTITNSGANFSFDAIEFTAPGTYVYTITETGTVAGVTNDSAKTVTIVVTDDGKGQLQAAFAEGSATQAVFTNTYGVNATTATINVTKVLTGAQTGLILPDISGEYTFTLAAVTTGAPMPEKRSVTNETSNEMSFGPITFNTIGEYEYQITETGTVAGVTNDGAKTVTIVVTDNGAGGLVAQVKMDGQKVDGVTFTNTYAPAAAKASIPVQKLLSIPAGLTGPADISKAFTFELKAVTAGAPMPKETTATNPDANGGAFSFGEITFSAPGDYAYEITETGTVAGVMNDSAKKVTIKVTDNGTGALSATVVGGTVTFTNTYGITENVQAVIPVEKTLEVNSGNDPDSIVGKFTFTLAADADNLGGAVMPAELTVTNPDAKGGKASFGAITFTAPGTYKFTVTESVTAGYEDQVGGITNDEEATKTVTIVVEDNGAGKLVINEAASDYKSVKFVNEYAVTAVEVSFPIQKMIEVGTGLTAPDAKGMFSFTLTPVDGAPQPAVLSQTNPDANGGVMDFGPITFNAPGTYEYTISETVEAGKDASGFTLADAETVTIQVEDNGQGQLTYTASSTKDDILTFTNTYSVEPIKATIKVEKEVTGEGAPDIKNAFTFTLSAAKDVPMPASTEKTNPDVDGGVITFGEIEFDQPGTYAYTVTESGAVTGIVNDSQSAKTVQIQVVDNGNGTMTATVSPETVKFTNKYSVIDLSGTKVWEDQDNKYNTRPASITVNAKNGDEVVKSVTVTPVGDDWSWTIEDLPQYDAAGKAISYTITEDAVVGYDTEVDGTEITNTLKTIDLSGTKVWEDQDNKYDTRPATITINAKNGDEVVKSVTVTPVGDDWSWTIEDLPQYDAAGKEISYTITEDAVVGYDTEVDGTEITNTLKTIDLSGTKVWDDQDNKYDTRPVSITVNAKNGDEVVKSVTVTPVGDDWSWTIEDLPQYDAAGKVISYTITEDAVVGYDSEVDGTEITNTLKTKDVTVTKKWEDNSDQDGKRPDTIELLLKSGNEVVGRQTLNAKNGDEQSYIFADVPATANGVAITYTVDETSVPEGYTKSVAGLTITNTHEPEKTSLSGTKVWDDANDQDGKRPDSITINLMKQVGEDDAVSAGESITLSESSGWDWEFTGLARYEAGKMVTYSVTEEQVAGYTTNIAADENGYVTITNSYTPEIISVSGAKTWDDLDNIDRFRPTEVVINLLADGTKIDSQTVRANGEDQWLYSFTNLPKYRDQGTEIKYTVTEDAIAKYFPTITATNDGFDIVNKAVLPKLQVEKTSDKQEQTVKLGETINYTITVTNTGNVTVYHVFVEDKLTDENWTIDELAIGATATFKTSYEVTSDDILAGTVLNHVTAKGDPVDDPSDPENPKVPEGEDEVEDDPEPIDTTLIVEKTSDKQGQTVALGETITYTIKVTNDGNVPFKNVKVVDELTGDAWTIATLAVGATETFTATHVVTSDDILAGTVLNSVTAKADPIPDPDDPENPKVPEGEDEVEDDPEPIDTTLVVEKTSDVATTAQVGDTITYTITVTNMGNVPYTNMKVDDELTGMHETISVLAVGESQTLTTTRVVTVADAVAGSILNVAVATADPIPDPDDPTTPKVPEGTDTEEDDVDPIPPVEPAKYRVTVRYWYEYVDGKKAAKTFKQQYTTGDSFHVTSPIIPGYTVDVDAVTGVMETEDLIFDVIYTPEEYTLTIEYIYADGTPAAPTYTDTLSAGDKYDVDSPEITGYRASEKKVKGKMPAREMTVTVIYVKIGRGWIIIDDYNTPLGIGNVNLNAGECFE